MKVFLLISDILDKIVKKIITIFLMLMTVILFSQVISRYLFSTGLTWSEEIVRYMCVWIVYLGATCATKNNSHISVTALEEILPDSLKKWLVHIQRLIVSVYLVLVLWIGTSMLGVAKLQTSPNMRIPMNIIYSVIPISMIIMIIHIIALFLQWRGTSKASNA